MSNLDLISRLLVCRKWIVGMLMLLTFLQATIFSPANAAEPVKIGVLAFRSKPQTLKQWQPLAAALKQAIPDRDFVVEVYSLPELNLAVASRQLDFVLTNSGHFVLLSKRSGLSSPLATLAIEEQGQVVSVFGGVIFTRANTTGIDVLHDLKGKTIAVVGTDSLGGYQAQAYELKQKGVHLPKDAKLLTTGMPQDNVVKEVLEGRAEVGFVRSGVLEAMAREGKLSMGQIKIINGQKLTGLPVQVSTSLYPEWAFAALPHIDENLARRVVAALFLMDKDSASTKAMGIHGFIIPADYTPVVELLRNLRMAPFDDAPVFTLQDVWVQYRWQLISMLGASAFIFLLLLRLALTNRKLDIAHRLVLQQKQLLQENKDRLEAILDAIPDLMFELSQEGKYINVWTQNPELLTAQKEILLGHTVKEILSPEAAEIVMTGLSQAEEKGHSRGQIIRLSLPKGDRWFELSTSFKQATDVSDKCFIMLSRDITERKRAEESVLVTASVFDNSQEGILISDANNSIIDANPAFTRITGYSREEVLGKNPRLLNSGRQGKVFYDKMWQSLELTGAWRGEVWNQRKSGEIYAELLSISAISGSDGKVLRYVAVFSDISHIKEHEAELSRVAHYDALTGIPNRVLLADRMKQAISQTSREQTMMAICYLDLDGFKPINDTLGHDAGDQILIEVAKRIQHTIRGGDTVARLGGDEFVVLLLELDKGEECVSTLERLLAAIAQPIIVKDKSNTISASIGVSIYPLDEEDPDTLLRHADQAMYMAKQSGKNRFYIYDPALDRRARDQNAFLKSIRNGLEHHQFELLYQPKVNLRTQEMVGAEALIRWRHPERGLLSPAEFLRHVENTDLDIEIGEWVTATALAQIDYWRNHGLDIEVSINISGYHLESPRFVERLQQQLAHYPDMPSGKLQIEVLETVALNDIAIVRGIIESCRTFGVGFALDDFGTGYSSLSYLSGLPVDVLKIDQSFVRDMLDDKGDMAIVQGIIALARAFDRNTVAEGIETRDHYLVLRDMGCEMGQGYGIAKPMPAGELTNWHANFSL